MPSLPQMCAICRDDIEEVAPGVVRPIINRELTETCNHVFHDYCIEGLRAHNVNCPNCRSPIYDVEDLTHPREDLVHNYRESVDYFHYEKDESIILDTISLSEKYAYISREYNLLGFLCRDFIPVLEKLAINFQNERYLISRKKQLFAMIRAHVKFASIDFGHARNILYLRINPRPGICNNSRIGSVNYLTKRTDLLENLHNLFRDNSEDTIELQTQVIGLLLERPLRGLISNNDLQGSSNHIFPQCFEIPIVDVSRVFPSNYWDGRVSRLFRSPENRMSGGFLDPLLRYAGVSFGRNNATSDRLEESNETQRSYGFFSYVYSLWESLLSKIIAIFGFGEI